MGPEFIILIEAAFAVGLILFFIVNKDFTYGIYTWLLASLLFKYQKISVVDSILPDMSLDRVLFVFLVVIFILEILTRRRRIFSFTKVEYSMFLFCLAAVISMIWTGTIIKDGGKLKIGELLTGYIVPFFMFFLSQNVYANNTSKREGFLKFIILIGLYLSLTAIFEHMKINKLVFPRYILDADFGIHFGRARGPFGQAAVNGTVLGFVFSAIFYFLFNYNKSRFWKLCAIFLLATTPLAIFFTYTRACWLGAMISFMVISIFTFKQSQKAFAVTAVLFCIVAMLVAPSFLDDNTMAFAHERFRHEEPVYDRLNLYVAYINMFINNPIFGVGFLKFSEQASDYFADMDMESMPFQYTELKEHDTFAGILAEMGLVGITLILIIYTSILMASVRLYKNLRVHNPEAKPIVIIFWGSMALFVVNAVFIEMRYFEFVNSMFFIFAGIIYGWQREYGKKTA